MRNPLARLRRPPTADPPAPIPPAEAERLGRAPDDAAFVTGNGFAARCRYVLNYDGLTENEDVGNDWWFCRTDHLQWFLERHAPRQPFVLVSHNSDYPIDERFRPDLRRRNLRAWLAANAGLRHPKLIPIPLGIANPAWQHGDTAALREARRAAPDRSELFDVSFSIDTNPGERRYCLEQTGLTPAQPLPHREYLERLASAYFCIAPRGYGIDTHRVWEALYLRTVPVVTRSLLTDEYPDLPAVVLSDWAEFRSIEFSAELYERVLGAWDPATLTMDAVFARLWRRVASLA